MNLQQMQLNVVIWQ